jgi:hypothetical protein
MAWFPPSYTNIFIFIISYHVSVVKGNLFESSGFSVFFHPALALVGKWWYNEHIKEMITEVSQYDLQQTVTKYPPLAVLFRGVCVSYCVQSGRQRSG